MDDFDFIDTDASPLREALTQAIKEERSAGRKCTLAKLTVLANQNDPFRLDTPANHRIGEWLADTAERLVGTRTVHLRGLHYACIGERKPDGTQYTNTNRDWVWLSEKAAKAARWLQYLDFDQIVDQRNAEPVIREYVEPEPEWALESGIDIDLPSVADVMPRPVTHGFRGSQRYHLVMGGEKSSLEPVLGPIAEAHQADWYQPTGELSDTMLHRMATSAAEDGRDLVVLWYADADPAGWQMSISAARKLQALQELVPMMPDFRVFRVALSPDQVRTYGLPSTPLKPEEKRADKWRRKMHTEQTEVDSLAALRPDLLRQIALDSLRPFYDHSLAARVADARHEWLVSARAIIADEMGTRRMASLREDATRVLNAVRVDIADLNERLELDADDFAMDDLEVPEPELIAVPPPPLVSSDWSFARQCLALKNSKAYGA